MGQPADLHPEVIDFLICREMHISLAELQKESRYVRKLWFDLIQVLPKRG